MSIFQEVVPELEEGKRDFFTICSGLKIVKLSKGTYIFQSKTFIERVFFCLRGEALKVKETVLNLEKVLNRPPTNLTNFMGLYMRKFLKAKQHSIFAKTQIEKIHNKNVPIAEFGVDK